MSEVSPARLLTRSFILLSLADLAYFTAGGMLLGTTPIFASRVLDADTVGVGVAMGSFSLTTLVLRPWVGRAADRRGVKPVMLAGAAAFAVLTVGHFLVDDLLGLTLLRLLLGAAEALFFVAGFAALAHLAPQGRAGEALSLNSLALFAGLAAGPPVAQWASEAHGLGLVWVAAAGLCGVAAVLVALLPRVGPTVAPGAPATPLIHRPSLRPGVALLAGMVVSSAFLGFAGLYAQQLSIQAWSLVLGTYGATVVICRVALAKVPDRVGPRRLAALALGLQAVALMGLWAIRHPAGLFGAAAVVGVGVALLTPAVFAEVMGHLPPGETGAAAATTSMFIDVGLSAGPVLLGLLAAGAGLPGAFLLLTLLPLAGMVSLRRPALPARTTNPR